MAIALSFDRDQRLLLVDYSYAYDRDGLAELDRHIARFLKEEGPADAIFDLSKVTQIDMPTPDVRRHGRKPTQLPNNKRAMIASADVLYGLLRMYAQHQELIGTSAPEIVRTMDEALAAVGHVNPVLKPWPERG